jgi:hypothetical protein
MTSITRPSHLRPGVEPTAAGLGLPGEGLVDAHELAAWLGGVLAREERIATRALQVTDAVWDAGTGKHSDHVFLGDASGSLRAPSEEVAGHISDNDPQRVLERVQAERSVLSAYREAAQHPDRGSGVAAGLLLALQWLAWGRRNVSAGHRREWTPTRH